VRTVAGSRRRSPAAAIPLHQPKQAR
jgi:hypothetical protein